MTVVWLNQMWVLSPCNVVCLLCLRDLIINEPAVLADVIFCTLHCSTAGSGLLTVARFNHLYVVQGTGTFGTGTGTTGTCIALHCPLISQGQSGAICSPSHPRTGSVLLPELTICLRAFLSTKLHWKKTRWY